MTDDRGGAGETFQKITAAGFQRCKSLAVRAAVVPTQPGPGEKVGMSRAKFGKTRSGEGTCINLDKPLIGPKRAPEEELSCLHRPALRAADPIRLQGPCHIPQGTRLRPTPVGEGRVAPALQALLAVPLGLAMTDEVEVGKHLICAIECESLQGRQLKRTKIRP